jgi:endonuclease-8
MPEGHMIHRVAREHRRKLCHQPLEVTSPQGRFHDSATRLNGQQIREIEAHGKHLFYDWEHGEILHIHLGLYGKFRPHRAPAPAPVGAVRLRVMGPSHGFDLNGPNACELISASQQHALRSRLGADPLRKDADVDRAWQRIANSRVAIGSLLLDQSVIAGVGNVYRAEVLHVIGMHPERPGNQVSQEEFMSLWRTLSKLMKIGVKYNRIITAQPKDVGKSLGRMNRSERLQCYKRATCARCGNAIQQWQLKARTMYACPNCQQ